MARCKRLPTIRTYDAALGVPVTVQVPASTVEYTIRARSAVAALLVAIDGAPDNQLSVRANEVLVDGDLRLGRDLKLLVTADAATVLEVWLWDG